MRRKSVHNAANVRLALSKASFTSSACCRSIREAVESGLFDVTSGELVNPISGRHYPIQRAVQMRLVQTSPEKAHKLSDALAQAQQQHAHIVRPGSQFSPGSISLGSGGGGGGIASSYSYAQRRSSFGPEERCAYNGEA